MDYNILKVTANTWPCGKFIKSTCVPGSFEFADPCECDGSRSFFDLCDTPPCQANSVLISPNTCTGGECGDQLRWITFEDLAAEIGTGDRYVAATFDDTNPRELEQELRICPANTSTGLFKIVPKSSGPGNKFLEMCIDESKLTKNTKLIELTDGPGVLGNCNTLLVNGKNLPAYSTLVTAPGATTWDWRCPRISYNAGIYMDGLYEATFPTDEVNVITGIYQFMEHLPWNNSSMNANAGVFGNVIRIQSDGLYELEAKLAYHVNSYVNAIKLEIFNVGTGQSLGGDKDGVQANDNQYTTPWADGEQSTDGTSTGPYNAQMNNKINNLKVNVTAWLTAGALIGIRSRVSTQVSTTPLTTEDGKILVGPVSVYSADDPKGSTYLYVKEVPMITY